MGKRHAKWVIGGFAGVLVLTALPTAAQFTLATDKAIEECFIQPAAISTERQYQTCLTAFETASKHAQLPHHSDMWRNLYWAQAGKAGGIALIQKITIDKAMSKDACEIARRSLQAYAQINPEGEPGSAFAATNTIQDFFEKCEELDFFEVARRAD